MDDWRKSLPPVQGFHHNHEDDNDDNNVQSVTQNLLAIPRAQRTYSRPRQQALPFVSAHWSATKLIQRVEIGVKIELSTIPLYLYAMYSVSLTNQSTKEGGLRARGILRGVLHQEMLHLALAGNLLSALGGSLDLYKREVVPVYPGTVLMDEIPMTLRALDAESLGYFIEIEGPNQDRFAGPDSSPRNAASGYESIGELYENVITGVRTLSDNTFANNPNNQFTGDDFFGDQLFAITDRNTALQALRLIIEQGEGNTRMENSHLDVFSELRKKPDSWDVYPVPEDPKTSRYAADPYIYKLSLAFDAAYCYLLQTIQRVWRENEYQTRRVLFRNIHAIMSNVLTPLAEILLQQPWKGGVAAPCFNYYAMTGEVGGDLINSSGPLAPDVLHKQLSNRMKDAANATSNIQEKFTLQRIDRYINENIKPSK